MRGILGEKSSRNLISTRGPWFARMYAYVQFLAPSSQGGYMSWVRSILKATSAYSLAVSYLYKTAVHYYKKKIENDADLKAIIDELNQMKTLETHYGHKEYKDERILLDLSIQLAEIIRTLKGRLSAVDPNYRDASFLDAGDPDRIILRSLGCKKGISLNILDSCVKQVKDVGGLPVKGDVQMMPFRDKSFDYVLCFETLEHLENPILGLKELSRVSAKKVFISIPWVEKTQIHRNNYMPGEPAVENHIFEFNQEDFAKIATHADLEITYYKEIKMFPKILNPIDNFFLKKFYYPSYFPKYQFYELTKSGANA